MDKDNKFVIFSEAITHASVKSNDLSEIVGAGFCTIAVGYKDHEEVPNVHCFGESISLGIKSREIDEDIINEKINNKYA